MGGFKRGVGLFQRLALHLHFDLMDLQFMNQFCLIQGVAIGFSAGCNLLKTRFSREAKLVSAFW